MKKSFIFTLLFFCTITVFSQDWQFEKPDYKKIKKNIRDESSSLYYPLLMDRYDKGDTTMTLEEKRHLYFGYSFQPEYSPYGSSDYMDSLKTILSKDTLGTADHEKMIIFSDSILREYPFDLRVMSYRLYALEKQGDMAAFNITRHKMDLLVDALLSSGNGLTKKDAFYVIFISHEYFLLNILGLPFGGKQSLIEHYDYLETGENPYGIEGLYFDISRCLDSLNKMFKN